MKRSQSVLEILSVFCFSPLPASSSLSHPVRPTHPRHPGLVGCGMECGIVYRVFSDFLFFLFSFFHPHLITIIDHKTMNDDGQEVGIIGS